MAKWSPQQIPSLTGKTAVVTGASSGIGASAADVLAAKGARVVLAVRSQAKGDTVRTDILRRHPSADVAVGLVDMADLASIRAFAARMDDATIDILLNNAGLGMQPVRAMTKDGFERQFGTNHLGHFALTGLLLPALLRAAAPRVVAISSIAHRTGKIDFDDLQGERVYKGGKAYNQSKLANLMFALELDRRARAAGSRLVSVAAHPGISSTGFLDATNMPGYQVAIGKTVIGFIGQDGDRGALPGLYAATMPDVKGGQYWGPDGLLEIRGDPKLARIASQARDQAAQVKLWTVSEQLTGVTYGPLDAAVDKAA
jgi:NAD(P)-dependent dehydrogenase (short-subunit alcohol dehydrogenase family)